MPNLCECGKLHYNLDHYFSVHGDYLGNIREHRQQVEVLTFRKPFPFLSGIFIKNRQMFF
jgi:hypothetical protein